MATQLWQNTVSGKLKEYYKSPGSAWRPAPSSLVRRIQEEKGRKAQEKREKQGIGALQQAIALFDKDFGKGMEARARASASSAAVTSGLGGTTRPGAVSAGLSAEFEDMRRGRLSGALGNLQVFLVLIVIRMLSHLEFHWVKKDLNNGDERQEHS